MKKLWVLLAATAIVSCNKEASVDYALISGKISNADKKEITLRSVNNPSFKSHKIVLKEDGTFTDTIKVAGHFTLYQARNATPLHLEAGTNITINFDAKDFDSSLTLSGNGAETSTYLVAKNSKAKELMGKGTGVYTQGEVDYKKTFYSIKTAQKDLLNTATGISDAYKAKEERNIQYAYWAN